MKKILSLFVLFFAFLISGSNYSLAQLAACSGTLDATTQLGTGAGTSATQVGNGTPGCIRICLTVNSMASNSCMGLPTRVRIYNNAGTLLTSWNSGTAVGTCLTLTTTDGYVRLGRACWGGNATITWETVNCTSGVNVCCTPNCNNGIQDCNETGIDCGGPDCAVCASANPCENGIQDGTETGVDCGGSCPPCGTVTACAYDFVVSQTGIPSNGIIDLTGGGTQTINSCITYKYTNSGSNWVHGTFIPTNTIGFTSVSSSGTPPEPITSMGTTYTWTFNNAPNFTSSNSGQTITSGGYYVETGTTFNPGNNLGYPRGAGTVIGPFCFNTVLSCSGAGAGPGENFGILRFGITSDSYSGSWTNNSCQIQLTSGAAAYNYTLVCPVVLPLELISFEAFRTGRNINVMWKTATEREIASYIVEKSYDGYSYSQHKEVNGPETGSSLSENSYMIEDVDDISNNIYYRLREMDFNGNKSDVSIAFLPADFTLEEISILPNPVDDFAEINFYSSIQSDAIFRIHDISGKLIEDFSFIANKGKNTYVINTDNFKQGMYILELSSLNKTKQVKFIK
jgi:hypothetical protein